MQEGRQTLGGKPSVSKNVFSCCNFHCNTFHFSRYCQTMDIDTTAAGESGLKIKFFADKKKSGGGAQCTVQCTEAAGIYST